MATLETIATKFPIFPEEFDELDKKFGKLCHFQSWQLDKKNDINKIEDQEDFAQELKLALVMAGSYYKRQIYIEACFAKCYEYVDDELCLDLLGKLEDLWRNRTRHGANKQKFGEHQEDMLDKIVKSFVPKTERPSKLKKLEIDSKFATYCKAITWNRQKALGKKISREKNIRSGMVSLSEYDYLGSSMDD